MYSIGSYAFSLECPACQRLPYILHTQSPSQEVKLHTAECLAKLLRTCAPETPFTDEELKVRGGGYQFRGRVSVFDWGLGCLL